MGGQLGRCLRGVGEAQSQREKLGSRGSDDEREAACGGRDRAERGSLGQRGETRTRKTERRSSANESLESNFLATKMKAKKNKLLGERCRGRRVVRVRRMREGEGRQAGGDGQARRKEEEERG